MTQTGAKAGTPLEPVLLAGDSGYGIFSLPGSVIPNGAWSCTTWAPGERKQNVLLGRIVRPAQNDGDLPLVVPVTGRAFDLLMMWVSAAQYREQARAELFQLTVHGRIVPIEQAPGVRSVPDIVFSSTYALRVDLTNHITWLIINDDDGLPMQAKELTASPELGQAGIAFSAGLHATEHLSAELAELAELP